MNDRIEIINADTPRYPEPESHLRTNVMIEIGPPF